VCSLGIGIALGVAVLGYRYEQARVADARLRSLVAHCQNNGVHTAKQSATLPPGYILKPIQPSAAATAMNPSVPHANPGGGRWVPLSPGAERGDLVCDPEDLVGLPDLVGEQAQIANTSREANNDRANGRLFGLLTLAGFCIPAGWYFFLDRLREISDALSGRDRSAR
jgi:hypothetical protein